MSKIRRFAITATFAMVVGYSAIGAASASISMTIDRDMIDFRTMDPGETRELSDQGVYHNQITLSSTNNKTWYLKAHLLRPFTSGANSIPNQNFRWKVISIGSGRGTVYNNVNTENAFSNQPSLIYTSADSDNTGTEVVLQLRYILEVPKNQIAGNYDAVIRFTIIEIL